VLHPQTHTIATAKQSRVFLQKFKFILMKMHKNCCHKCCSFWLRYAPNRLLAGASPQIQLGKFKALPRPPSWFREWGPWEREGGRGGREPNPNPITFLKFLELIGKVYKTKKVQSTNCNCTYCSSYYRYPIFLTKYFTAAYGYFYFCTKAINTNKSWPM